MKRFAYIALLMALILLPASCVREEAPETSTTLPDGTPVTLLIPFGAEDSMGIDVGTKAEASRTDESRVHDLYVFIFDESGDKFYGRYFTYEHLTQDLSDLGTNANEGWWVDNVTASDASTVKTQGVVKISTEARTNCTLVVVANLDNSVTALDGEDPIDCLAQISTLTELQSVKVSLEQNVVNRDDLFLMLDYKTGLSTSDMVWYTDGTPNYTTPNYNSDYKVTLERIDAKVKFRVKVNTTYVSEIEPRYWQVYNVPSSCYLYPSASDPSGEDRFYFDTDQSYFEGEETDSDGTWQVFTFYMLENRQTMKKTAGDDYYNREKQVKINRQDTSDGVLYDNGDWEYAPDEGTYVKFDVVLTLTSKGITQITNKGGSALTTDAVFTVHLGNFSEGPNYDDYNTLRNHSYSYDITLTNSESIYVEVTDEDRNKEPQAGHEGSLLFATDEIVQCDAHYVYHSLTFNYNASLDRTKISWNVKTPFCEGGAKWDADAGDWVISGSVIDYEWVKFALNDVSDDAYTAIREDYPGDSAYDPTWAPGTTPQPQLLNIHQLIQYLFDQTDKERNGNSDFKNGVIRMTAFVNEYYYEKDPRTGKLNPDLWREFVNAAPREMHILSDASISADGQSDIVNSTHSIIQRSIQTIYNVSSPYLTSAWGTEHTDEMRNRGELESGAVVHSGWTWSGGQNLTSNNAYCNDIENGRYNTAGLWGVNPTPAELPEWETFLKYNVDNTVPELRDGSDGGEHTTNYQLMAYSCLTRNRDNNGDGYINPEEIRWYLASRNQVFGLWVGNEALSPTARIYQPQDASSQNGYLWRSHVVTSTCSGNGNNPTVIVAEEGTSTYLYGSRSWNAFNPNTSAESAWNKIQSVRCVRNVGTFDDNGARRDISYAPVDTEVDKYYEASAGYDGNGRLNPNTDGTYTLRFDNLNTKSIREYTSIDLPYHDEYSAHNRVYLQLDIQNPSEGITPASKLTVYNLNNDISQKGHNEFCPTGYRLPNMTELSLMKSLLPDAFWTGSGNTARPCRTYFSKGYLGSQYTSEAEKIGWVYSCGSKYINLTEWDNAAIDGFRCVRDDNLTGDISGKLSLSKKSVHVNGNTEVRFNFTSTASAFTDVALALCYKDASGNDKELSIPVSNLELYGMTLRGSFTYTIPDVSVLGDMSFKATLKNAAGQIKSFTTPVTILSDIDVSIRLLPCEYDADRANAQFPILVNAISDGTVAFNTAKLRVVSPDGIAKTFTLSTASSAPWSMVYNYTDGGSITDFDDLQIGTYTFQFYVEDASDTPVFTKEVSMDVLLKDSQPNGAYWSVTAGGDLGENDFIEAKMDVSGIADQARENILSVGTKITKADGESDYTKTYAFHLFYPDAASNNKTRLEPVAGSGLISERLCYLSANGTFNANPSDLLIFRVDPSGVYWNSFDYLDSSFGSYDANKTKRYNALLEDLCSQNELLIGAMREDGPSYADYKYIRVVRNGTATADDSMQWDGSFEDDPVDGGYL